MSNVTLDDDVELLLIGYGISSLKSSIPIGDGGLICSMEGDDHGGRACIYDFARSTGDLSFSKACIPVKLFVKPNYHYEIIPS